MKRAPMLASLLLLTTLGFAQQPATSDNPQDRTYNPNDRTTYNQPTTEHRGWGNWGLLGLFGLAGLLGRGKRDTATTTTYTRDDRTYDAQRRRVG